jgi:hypothetical protein
VITGILLSVELWGEVAVYIRPWVNVDIFDISTGVVVIAVDVMIEEDADVVDTDVVGRLSLKKHRWL